MAVVKSDDEKLQELDAKMLKLKAEGDVLALEQKKLSAKFTANYNKLQKLGVEAMTMRFDSQLKGGKFDWEMLLKYEHTEPNYKFKNKALEMTFPQRHAYADGYFPSTEQYALEIRLDHESVTLLDHINQVFVEQLLPVIKPVTVERTKIVCKMIKVMEPGLSVDGSHRICVFDDRCEFHVARSYRSTCKHTTATFREMLDYVQSNYAFGPME